MPLFLRQIHSHFRARNNLFRACFRPAYAYIGIDYLDKAGDGTDFGYARGRFTCRTGWPKAGPERVVPGPKVGVDLPQE
ncbi:hypothetical protein ACRALDRAFT_209308 [Sodiomyces alcalophilus JCM 7366]|uniref:uncharacterized protein n=1 Tax=Sodiomyces alcalophilus JCM 7366 TaxID=591952 RepID=UPI0039B5351D